MKRRTFMLALQSITPGTIAQVDEMHVSEYL